MSCVVIRNKNNPRGLPIKLSEDARRRAKEYLKSAGIDIDRIPKINWPEDAVSAHQKHRRAPWEYTTRTDLKRQRQHNAKEALWFKREYGAVHRQALYVWVFWCPGIGGGRGPGLMSGWYAYIIGTGISHALNFRGYAHELNSRLMELFPLVKPRTLFDGPDFSEWMMEWGDGVL